MKFILTNIKVDQKLLTSLPFDLSIQEVGSLNVLTEDLDEIKNTTFHYSITDGYLRDFNKKVTDFEGHEESVIEEISKTWPLPNNISGSFSTLLINKNSLEIILCNDPIGIYPLYYLKDEKGLFVSNSIILIGAISQCEFDEVGIIQRCIGPEFSNFGSRTILKNCKRVLPGEYIKFDDIGDKILTKYDNTLYQNISKPSQGNNIHKEFWNAYKQELDYCLYDSSNVNIALSGGLDSRIVLGAIPKKKMTTCLTFGDKNNYETKIASRLAKLKNADFKNFSQLDLYFPPVEILKKYTLQTEAVNLCSWLEILEEINEKSMEPILLGDMAEVLNGRNIKKFSTKEFRQNQFISHQILNKDYKFENSSEDSFINWKELISESHLRWYTEKRLSQFNVSISRKDLLNALQSDLSELFLRIEAHRLPYVELYDELFSWYTHTRIPMGKQILICGSKFRGFCPSMSLQILRLASSIHPNLRLNSRFMNKLFKESIELKELNKVPTSQAPLVPHNYPNIMRFGVWGIRSKLDQYFIKRLMKHKDIKMRYRLFESMNWAKIYHNPNMEINLKNYFHNNHLGDIYFKNLLNQSIQRRELTQWPFANLEIINASSLNMEIELIKSYKKEV